jgi:hypothetical protein
MGRSVIISLATALAVAGCGGSETVGDAATTTSSAATETSAAPTTSEGLVAPTTEALPAEFTFEESDDGAVIKVRPGDAITIRLPVEDPSDPQWVLVEEPDAAIVQIIDSLLWIPSEPGAGEVLFEFVFYVVGAGETDMRFSLGPPGSGSRSVGFAIASG